MTAPLLRVSGLRTWFPIRRGVWQKTVGWVRAVDGVDLEVNEGETVALVGESGCGKTTVGRSITRLIEPCAGSVTFAGQELTKLTPRQLRTARRHIQMVFQDPATSLNPRMRVRDILAEGLEAFGIGSGVSERTDRVAELLKRVRLEPEHMKRFPHEFSGGQRQRIGIARALSVEPRLIVLDEAVSALDVSIQAQILNLLSRLQQEDGLAYLFITHDLSVVRYLARRVSVMYLGQIVEEAETEALFAQPQHPYTRGLLAAAPSADPEHPNIEARVLGDVPSPADPPKGCRFHTRCPEAFDRCSVEPPPVVQLGSRKVRCLLHEPAERDPGVSSESGSSGVAPGREAT
jgi:oligopeptide/dipeptide ABC transporter ATP-binding protein